MGSHPINLGIRFLLEVAALLAIGYWGWSQHDGVAQWLLALGLPLLAALLWGTFAVPDDPSRSGKAPIPIPGMLRLVLELSLFVAATALLIASLQPLWGVVLAVVTGLHYAASIDRIRWLLAQ